MKTDETSGLTGMIVALGEAVFMVNGLAKSRSQFPERVGVPPASLGVPPKLPNYDEGLISPLMKAPRSLARKYSLAFCDLPSETPGKAGGTPTLPGDSLRRSE